MSAALSDLERFKLAPPPASPRAALEQTIRARHAERDRVARRDPAYEALRARAFICMAREISGEPVHYGRKRPNSSKNYWQITQLPMRKVPSSLRRKAGH